MDTKNNASKPKTILSTAFWIVILIAYIAVMIWLFWTDGKLFLFGCIWRISDVSQILLVIVWVSEIILRIRNIKRTDDPKLKQERIRSCKFYGVFSGILTVLLISIIIMTFSEFRDTHFAVLGNDPNRAVLLREDGYGSFIHVYSKKGIIIRPEDEIKLLIYENTHIVANQQYTWETDGTTVTVRFETGGLAEGYGWDESSGSPAPPEIIEKVYTLPE